MVIGGDFNAKPSEKIIEEYMEEYKSAYYEGIGDHPLSTAIFGSIDYLFYKGPVEL